MSLLLRSKSWRELEGFHVFIPDLSKVSEEPRGFGWNFINRPLRFFDKYPDVHFHHQQIKLGRNKLTSETVKSAAKQNIWLFLTQINRNLTCFSQFFHDLLFPVISLLASKTFHLKQSENKKSPMKQTAHKSRYCLI